MLIVAFDANFRLKNRLRMSNAGDVGLHTGLAYFVDEAPYKAHVLKYATQEDVSSVYSLAGSTALLMLNVDQYLQRI